MEPDFSGYASRANQLCTDGATILPHAFSKQDGTRIPLVSEHDYGGLETNLGYALIEDRPDGTYVRGYFHDTDAGREARALVKSKRITAMSIFADRLVRKGKTVAYGVLREISLVMKGANPGAYIDYVNLAHSDGSSLSAAVIYGGELIVHSDDSDNDLDGDTNEGEHMSKTANDAVDTSSIGEATLDIRDPTLRGVYETMNEEQRALSHYFLGLNVSEESEEEEASEVLKQVDSSNSDKSDGTSSDSTDDADDTEGSDTSGSSDADSTDDADDADSVEDTTDGEDTNNQDDESEETDQNNSDENNSDDIKHSKENTMTHRVFDKNLKDEPTKGATLTHSQIAEIVKTARSGRMLIQDAFLKHADTYGINNIELLFPEARVIGDTPDLLARQQDWVTDLLGSVTKRPHARIRSIVADLTPEKARARGYVTGKEKKNEVFDLLGRITTPTTLYKKQKIDRDDELDITDINVIVFLKDEMRLMLNEELARSILIGDGRDQDDPDKVRDPAGSTEGSGIRSVANDHYLYSAKRQIDGARSVIEIIDEIVTGREDYRGTGSPKFYTSTQFATKMLLARDKMDNRIYKSMQELADALMVSKIVEVEPMADTPEILGIMFNPIDYSVGTDKGGEMTFFEDFDIDFNQNKYLYETRGSGALTRVRSAVVFRRPLGTLVAPISPSFDGATNKITINDVTGVEYLHNGAIITGSLTITRDELITARPAKGFDFKPGATSWGFTYTAK